MKVVCIDIGSYHLTKGKVYDVEIVNKNVKTDFGYFIVNDKGFRHYIERNIFIPLSDIRDAKLNELGI